MAANQYAASGTLDQGSYPDLLNKSFDLVWLRRDQLAPTTLKPFFDVSQMGGGDDYKIAPVGSELPLVPVNGDRDQLAYFQPPSGFDQTFTVETRRSGIRVTLEMLQKDRFAKIAGMMSGQVKASMRTDEYSRAAILNAAFTGTAGADALSLCNNSHPCEENIGGTWDNLGTGALTGANLQALRLVMDNIVNAQGDPMDISAGTLVVHPNQLQKALELTQSTKRAEDALNAVTVLIGGLNVEVSKYMNATQYFLFGDLTGEEKGLHEVVQADWSVINNSPVDGTVKMDKQIRSIKKFGFTTSRNIAGSTGS